MEGTENARDQGVVAPAAASASDRLSGRLGIVVDGKTIAALRIDGGGATLEAGDGETRASVLITNMEQLQRLARGELNLVVASLRGSLSLRGDVAFGVRALRALQGGMPVQGLAQGSTTQGG